MSVQSLTKVFEHSLSEGTARLVLLSIANHDGDGGSWPSIATIAREARRSERAVQMALRELEKLGEIRIHAQEGGTRNTRADRRTNMYEITIEQRPPHPPATAVESVDNPVPDPSDGVQSAAPRDGHGVQPDVERGAESGTHGVQTSAPEPSKNHPEPSTTLAAVRVDDRLPVDNSRDVAAAGDDPELDLDCPPTPPTRTAQPAEIAETVEAVAPNAGHLVARWCEGWTARRGRQPDPAVVKRVAGACRQVARTRTSRDSWVLAWEAAYAAGHAGRHDVVQHLADYRPPHGSSGVDWDKALADARALDQTRARAQR